MVHEEVVLEVILLLCVIVVAGTTNIPSSLLWFGIVSSDARVKMFVYCFVHE